ncbi:hypothetical protein PBNK65E_000281600 [Plasmodium berghei]|uniref:Uncharacterized protein n=1 Tax=Plasmodium berghei TaxID=5821 RepID=A0A0Y9XUL9_PLABE|nr:hypothetical protein PBK173_000289400 [Plasmodium berghei]SCM23898.1 hypothetical protein PBNK65NY_000281000 [Plasmodium berghei]SCN26827.1 hypothetical protein PBNK65E_000281600 [Plasmodium berghei]SCO61198.1 hypothetical protein PBSP11RLL_000281300 [Plasmodium berghei]SCO63247.1 hypothetical protein PBSP11A_000280900 [Plasmodium berghei]
MYSTFLTIIIAPLNIERILSDDSSSNITSKGYVEPFASVNEKGIGYLPNSTSSEGLNKSKNKTTILIMSL